ncbi:MAG: hypothetical protein MUF01_09725 [Bryobacterales bacterium]|jgi:hypothetical protein|nr:hypothetical protein [Bryobacterales bacterium]
MNSLQRILNQIWFPAMPATRLAFLRIAIGLFAFWYVAQRYGMFLKVAATEHSLFTPLGAVWWMSAPISVGAFEALLVATLIANAAFIVGWKHRFTGPAFGLLLLVLLSYRNSWTMIYHSDNAMVLHALILGFLPAADAWSMDAWLKARRLGSRILQAPPLCHWRYGWAIQLVSAGTAISYFLAGVAKLMGDLGWNWISGDSLRSQVAVDTIRKALLGESTPELAFALYEHVWLFTLIGVASMVVELGAPLALLNRRVGMLWALNAFAMHWGILFIMGITFRYQLAGLIFLSFFPVERLVPLGKGLLRWFAPQDEDTPAPVTSQGGVR